jgi:hypothetical protein
MFSNKVRDGKGEGSTSDNSFLPDCCSGFLCTYCLDSHPFYTFCQ